MKYYKTPDNFVYAFEADGSQDELIAPGMVAMTQEEVDAHINPPPTVEQIRAEAKATRSDLVAAIKVTTQAGNTFDGDEVSQGRMARAIIALQATGTPSVTWVLADNSVLQASAAELSQALALAGAAQAAVWVLP